MGRTPKYKPQKVFGRHKHRRANRGHPKILQGVEKCLREGLSKSCAAAHNYNAGTVGMINVLINESKYREEKIKNPELAQWERDARANLQWLKRRGAFLQDKIYFIARAEEMRKEKEPVQATNQENAASAGNLAGEPKTGPDPMDDGPTFGPNDDEASESLLAGDDYNDKEDNHENEASGKDSPASSADQFEEQLPVSPASSAGSNSLADEAEAGPQAVIGDAKEQPHDGPGQALLNWPDQPESDYASSSSPSIKEETPEEAVVGATEGPGHEYSPAASPSIREESQEYEPLTPVMGTDRNQEYSTASVLETEEGSRREDQEYSPASSLETEVRDSPENQEYSPASSDGMGGWQRNGRRPQFWESYEDLSAFLAPALPMPGISIAESLGGLDRNPLGQSISTQIAVSGMRRLALDYRLAGDHMTAIRAILSGRVPPPRTPRGFVYTPIGMPPDPPDHPRFWQSFGDFAARFWPEHTAPVYAAAEAIGAATTRPLPPGVEQGLTDLANEYFVEGPPVEAIRGILDGRSITPSTPLPSSTCPDDEPFPEMTSGLCPRTLREGGTNNGAAGEAEARPNEPDPPAASGDTRGPFWDRFEEIANRYWPLQLWPAQAAAQDIMGHEPLPPGAESGLLELTIEFAIRGDPQEEIRAILFGRTAAPGSWEWPGVPF